MSFRGPAIEVSIWKLLYEEGIMMSLIFNESLFVSRESE